MTALEWALDRLQSTTDFDLGSARPKASSPASILLDRRVERARGRQRLGRPDDYRLRCQIGSISGSSRGPFGSRPILPTSSSEAVLFAGCTGSFA